MIVDILIVLFLVSALARGREIGFVRQLCSTVGFFGGLVLGAVAQPHIVAHAHTTLTRAMLTRVTTLGFALVFLTIGEVAGVRLKQRLMQHRANSADVALGAIAGGLTLLFTVWLVAPVLLGLPFPSLQRALHNSAIVTKLSTSLPSAPSFLNKVERLIDPNGFPQVFVGLEPTPADTPLPDLGAMNAAVAKDKASVVKVEGQGCGGVVEGSGFVAADGFVATNAHVVAGIAQPYVIDGNGQHLATPVWFDPNLDLAVLRVGDLAGKPLQLSATAVAKGTPGAVLGYPSDGGFTPAAAAVLDEFDATGRNIYGQGDTDRDVYELKANIIPGNSGGPLIDQNGIVRGVVFAQSTTYDQVGYALAMRQVISELSQAETRNTPVATGTCAE